MKNRKYNYYKYLLEIINSTAIVTIESVEAPKKI